MNETETLRISKKAVAVDLTLAGGQPRHVEIFLAEQRANEFRRQDVLDLLEHEHAFLPVQDPGSPVREIINKDALLWIGVPLNPLGTETDAPEELFEFRRPVRVELVGAGALEGDLLYSAPQESTRLVDHLNETGRFLRLWAKDSLYLINKTFVLRIIETD
ncbi:MAG TPA: hypothetical protein VFZ57_00705 [Thermoanaerobaculia bacterium]|nr:hypothetical protein [Thermoanaerobaculia bacterium]